MFFVRPDRIGIWKCCNERRFDLQDRKKLFTHKLLIPSRNIYLSGSVPEIICIAEITLK